MTAGNAYVANGNSVRALDPVTGPLWTHPMDLPGSGNPAVAGGTVFAGSYDGQLYAVRLDGTAAWTSTAFLYVASEPTVVNGVVYVSGSREDGRYLVALDAASGAVLWQAQAPGNESFIDPVAVGDGRVYAGVWGTWLCAFDAVTGAALWSVKTGANPGVPSYWSGRVYVASHQSPHEGHLQAYDAVSGAPLWTSQAPTGPPGYAVSRPAVDRGDVSNNVFVASQDARLRAFDRDSGELAWETAIGGFGWPNDPTWTDAGSSPVGAGLRQYVTIDPLALAVPKYFLMINRPDPPPIDVIAARIGKAVGTRDRATLAVVLSQLKRIEDFAAALRRAIPDPDAGPPRQ